MRNNTVCNEAVTWKCFQPRRSLTALPIAMPSAATHCKRAIDVWIILALNSCLL